MSRDKNVTKFTYESFRMLKKRLGEFDAIVECNELAIREFVTKFDASKDKKLFIKNLSEKHDIRVDDVNVKLFSSRIRQFYITSVMQQAEQFFEEFRKEHRFYHSELIWRKREEGETDLDYLLDNVLSSRTQAIKLISKEVYHAADYYRLVRNKFAHSERDIKLLDNKLSKINEYAENYSSKFHVINAPNKYNEISFQDFLLCTNAIKHIGYTLCEYCRPSNKVIAQLLLDEKVEVGGKTINPLRNLLKLKNNKIRFTNAVENLLNSKFGRINASDRDEVIQNLSSILA